MQPPIPLPYSASPKKPMKVTFTEAQLAWLDAEFPEPVYCVGTNRERFQEQAIRRGVIHEIRAKLAKQNGGS